MLDNKIKIMLDYSQEYNKYKEETGFDEATINSLMLYNILDCYNKKTNIDKKTKYCDMSRRISGTLTYVHRNNLSLAEKIAIDFYNTDNNNNTGIKLLGDVFTYKPKYLNYEDNFIVYTHNLDNDKLANYPPFTKDAKISLSISPDKTNAIEIYNYICSVNKKFVPLQKLGTKIYSLGKIEFKNSLTDETLQNKANIKTTNAQIKR